tara:strand:+ start:135 stop:956 length:822 start_codon:yes stop_codon:yes gene_type:complete
MIRGLFLPEEGCQWGSFDYSAQEPRWLMHFAALTPDTRDHPKVKEIVTQYQKQDLDFHQMIADLAGVERSHAKTINLGIMYGMGLGKLASVLGDIPFEEAKALRKDYDDKVPFIRDLASAVMRAASQKAQIRTMMGRKCRFPMREQRSYSRLNKPIHFEKLEEQWQEILDTPMEERPDKWGTLDPGRYRVAFTFKALNRLIQACSADQTKIAMLQCYEAGYTPMLTVHDELCFSIENKPSVKEIVDIMENCVPEMQIPSKVDYGLSENWGLAK